MNKRLFFSTLLLIVLFSCSDERPDIRVACESTSYGNYLIKWETFPPMDGTVKIYESSSPDSFNMVSPIVEISIDKGFANILAIRNLNRSYFKLVFDKKYDLIASERTIRMNRIYNFRDLGGYRNKQGRQVKWGKIYRSSTLAPTPAPSLPGIFSRGFMDSDLTYMNNLGIKSLVNFRTEFDNFHHPCRYQAENSYNLPLRGNRIDVFADKILSMEMRRNDVIIYLQDVLSFLLENNSDYFARMFDILLDESNYPLVLYCSAGIDRSGLASALILSALDIPRDVIIDDFLFSNERVNYRALLPNADLFPEYVQETMTALYSAHKETITYALDKITKEYGSVNNYLEEELKLTPKKRERLKEILLN